MLQPEEIGDLVKELEENKTSSTAQDAPKKEEEETKVEASAEVKVEPEASAEEQTKANAHVQEPQEKTEVAEDGKDEVDDFTAKYFEEQFGETKEPEKKEPAAPDAASTEANAEKKEETASKGEDIQLSDLELWVIQAHREGKDITKELEVIFKADPNTMSVDELFEGMLKAENLSPDDIQAERENYELLSPLAKKNLVKSYKDALVKERADKLELLKPQAVQDNSGEIIAKATQRLSQLKEEKKGKHLLGMELTNDRMERISDFVSNEAPAIWSQDNTLNVDEMFEYATWKLYKEQIIKSNVTKYANEVKKAFLQDRLMPNGGGGKQINPGSKDRDSVLEETINNFNKP